MIVKEVSAGHVWQHYKGGQYIVTGLSLNEEDLTWNVLYEPYGLPDTEVPWSRPLGNWLSMVDMDGKLVPRFTLLFKVH